jgi:hypothetical protein
MFGDTHYVPVLRWKGAERGALRDLGMSDRKSITPLIELLPGHMRPRRAKHGPATSDDLWVVVEQLADACGPLPLFLDASRVQGTPYRSNVSLIRASPSWVIETRSATPLLSIFAAAPTVSWKLAGWFSQVVGITWSPAAPKAENNLGHTLIAA